MTASHARSETFHSLNALPCQWFAAGSRMCDYFRMGILDDNTLSILRDGRVIDTMHRLSERNPDKTAERGVKLDVRVRDKHGAEHTKKAILKKVG